MQKTQIIQVFGENVAAIDHRVESYGVLTQHAKKITRYCGGCRNLLIIRAPTQSSVKYRKQNPCGWDDSIAAKPVHVKEKTGGETTAAGFYSDYDILSYWKAAGGQYQRLITGGVVPATPAVKVTPENAPSLYKPYVLDMPDALFELIVSTQIVDFQHGANDEYVDVNGKPKNPLKNERFVAFDEHYLIHLIPDTGAMKRFYNDRKLNWIYK